MVHNPGEIVYEAIIAGNVELVRQQLKGHPELITARESDWLYDAATHDYVPMAQMLVDEFGVDVNWRRSQAEADRPLCAAARHGCLHMARWLLDRGADVNGSGGTSPLEEAATGGSVAMVQLLLDRGAKINVGGGGDCTPLAAAATFGSLEVARLLLERGADPNVLYGTMEYGDPPTSALKQALLFGHSEVAALLREHGAVLPPGCDLGSTQAQTGGVLEHIEQHLGEPHPLSLHEIVPGDPPVSIHVVPLQDCQALVTIGMSDLPISVPQGAEDFQFAELAIFLPVDWPLTLEALADPRHSWPIDWLRRIARYPHANRTWLGGRSAVIANGEPPKPLAPNTKLTCLLALVEANKFGSLRLPGGRLVVFYSLYPLYTQERDLERQKGLEELLRLLQEQKVSKIVDVHRPNVAL
jgi:hypothetical protein